MGRGEDDWPQVRRDLINELHSHENEYKQVFGSQQRIDELTHTLSYFKSCPGFDRWMTMPDMGHLVASQYNVVLYYLSLQQCLTFLPLRTAPLPPLQRREICIGFVNGNHFVQVFLMPGHPVPPIASNWTWWHSPCANGWESLYTSRIGHFRELVSSEVVTTETIELD